MMQISSRGRLGCKPEKTVGFSKMPGLNSTYNFCVGHQCPIYAPLQIVKIYDFFVNFIKLIIAKTAIIRAVIAPTRLMVNNKKSVESAKLHVARMGIQKVRLSKLNSFNILTDNSSSSMPLIKKHSMEFNIKLTEYPTMAISSVKSLSLESIFAALIRKANEPALKAANVQNWKFKNDSLLII